MAGVILRLKALVLDLVLKKAMLKQQKSARINSGTFQVENPNVFVPQLSARFADRACRRS